MKDHVEIDHLTKIDAFRKNRDQVVTKCEAASCASVFVRLKKTKSWTFKPDLLNPYKCP